MWPFRRKKPRTQPEETRALCPNCGSRDTRAISRDLTQEGSHVKTWRGQRFSSYRCSHCGWEFYAEEPKGGSDLDGERMIEDEEQLRAAEEELKRQTDADNDHRFWPNG